MTTGHIHVTTDLIAQVEQAEIEAWTDFYSAAGAGASRALGIAVSTNPSETITLASRLDILAFNRVLGLGLIVPISGETLERITLTYKRAGVPRFFVQLSPPVVTDEVSQLLRANGFSHYNNWVKLCRDVAPVPPLETSVVVDEITKSQARVFSRILVDSFDWPRALCPWIESAIGRPRWRFYLAYHKKRAVATAALFVSGDVGWIDFASTLPEARGKGAQAALLRRRIEDARRDGCRTIVVETAEQTRDREAPSFRNMIRYGFQTAYVRPNYIWRNIGQQG